MTSERVTAYHEAGHAVARFVLRRRIDRVSILPDDESRGHVQGYVLAKLGQDWDYTLRDVQMLEDQILSALAGPAAEERLTGDVDADGAVHDRTTAVDIAMHLEGGPEVVEPYLAYLDAKAHALVKTRWPMVEALAAELLERKQLSGPAARAILRRAYLSRG